MSKSCWQPSHFHMAVFPPRAARLWRMVTHAWAVIISHAGVSSGSLVLPCCCVMPRLGAGLHWRWRSEWSHISPFCKLCLIRARGNQRGTHSLPCDGTAQLRSAQCIGTRSHSSLLTHSHTHIHSLSLRLSHAHCCHHYRCWCCCWSCCWIISCSPHSGFHEEFIPLSSVFGLELHIVEKTRGRSTIHLQRCGKEFPWVCLTEAVWYRKQHTGAWWEKVTEEEQGPYLLRWREFAWRLFLRWECKGLGI